MWWLALIKDSEKHHKSEKLKKKSVQKLSLNTSKISIDQWVQTEQSLKNSDSEVFTEIDKD